MHSLHAPILSALAATTSLILAGPVVGQVPMEAPEWKETELARTEAYAQQLETHLRREILENYAARATRAWHRDYSSLDAFARSVAPNRERWRAVLNPPVLSKSGPLQRRPYPLLSDLKAEWVTLPLGDLVAEAILVLPPNASPQDPVPLVITQHGIGSMPESPFGPPDAAYHNYGNELLKAGFAVLSPLHLRSIERRNRVERLARLSGTTLPGIELSRLQNLMDEVLADPRIDRDRVGMWGVSLGGMATMFFTPLEPRIKACVVSAWFNHRLTKMVVPDERYTSFLTTAEEHAFFNGWLTEFADHDAITLICPRPVLVQHGKKDRIGHWPDLVKEFETARGHYEKLGIASCMELDLHEGGHEAIVASGVQFMKRWLKESPQK